MGLSDFVCALLRPLAPFCFTPEQVPLFARGLLRRESKGDDAHPDDEGDRLCYVAAVAEARGVQEARAAVEHGAHASEAACLLEDDPNYIFIP